MQRKLCDVKKLHFIKRNIATKTCIDRRIGKDGILCSGFREWESMQLLHSGGFQTKVKYFLYSLHVSKQWIIYIQKLDSALNMDIVSGYRLSRLSNANVVIVSGTTNCNSMLTLQYRVWVGIDWPAEEAFSRKYGALGRGNLW